MGSKNGATTPRFVPVEAKLHGPAPRDDLVPRGLIVDRLLESDGVPLVVVTGPPGFGKSVAVAQWELEDPRPFAWLTLDTTDDDPVVLVTYLAHALHRAGLVEEPLVAHVVEDDDGSAAAERLQRVVAASHRPFVLVLDSMETVGSAGVGTIVTQLVDEAPSGVQLVLIGRAVPSLDLDRWRGEGRLVEIGTADLRLTRGEAGALVELAGARLSSDEIDMLLERTEGWAAGMYLAVLGTDAADAGPQGADIGSESPVADYLRDEILLGLAPADREFLRRSSILPALSAPLCDEVLETTRSASALRRLARENIVMRHLTRPGWYRWHHLFAEAMQGELARQEPRLVKPLHARASRWLEENGHLDDAISHAIAAGDVETSGRLIWMRTPACVAAGDIEKVEDWLDAFTRQQVVADAKLAITAAWCALARGLPADHWISAAERGRYDAERPGESASVAAAVALLHALVGANGVVQVGADARLALELRGDEDEWTCVAELLDTCSTYLAGGAADARSRLEGVERHALAQGDHVVRTVALAQLAMMSLAEGDWVAAADEVERSAGVLEDSGGKVVALPVLVPCIRALLAAHAGRHDEARAQARAGSRGLARILEMAPWLAVQCRHVLARAHLELGDASAARTMLSEAQPLLRADPDARVLHDQVEEVWRQIEHLPIDVARGPSTLTTAELRVLQLLPTYLSFEEIGHQLFISRNTVKTQAIAAYRKLGVTSRAEAVERAQSMGLIGR